MPSMQIMPGRRQSPLSASWSAPASSWSKRTTVAPRARALEQPSKIVLWARASRKIVPPPASTGMTDMWMWVIVGNSRLSSHPSSSVSLVSISS
jgi:hypothetical protein